MKNHCDSATKGLSSTSNISAIIATRTPARVRRTSIKQDKFEFDAPQFEDFTQPRYLRKLQLLEQVVLPPEQRSEWTVHTVDSLTQDEDGATDADAEWFEIAHFEHEPSSPMSPAGPLITPVYNSNYSPMDSVLVQDTPHVSSSSKRLFTGGLRSKPMRIPRGASDASGSGSVGSLRSFYSEMEEIKSPTTGNRKGANARWQVVSLVDNNPTMLEENNTRMDPRTSISIERSLVGTRDSGMSRISGTSDLVIEDEKRIQSPIVPSDDELQGNMTTSPLNTNWSSIPATPLLLAAPLLFLHDSNDSQHRDKSKNEDTRLGTAEHDRKRSLPVSARRTSPLTRRIVGLASRAMRVPTSTATETKFFDSHEQSTQQKAIGSGYAPSPLRPRISPVVKRVKVNARFCPAPLPRSRQPSPPQQHKERISKKEKPVKLDDLKKLLAEHNQRLRPPPTNNITRRR